MGRLAAAVGWGNGSGQKLEGDHCYVLAARIGSAGTELTQIESLAAAQPSTCSRVTLRKGNSSHGRDAAVGADKAPVWHASATGNGKLAYLLHLLLICA